MSNWDNDLVLNPETPGLLVRPRGTESKRPRDTEADICQESVAGAGWLPGAPGERVA